jgi:flagellar hook-associated protein 3 FlgL
MTNTRITVGSAAYSGLAAINDSSSRLAKLQGQLSSGKQITTSSDNPTGTVRAMQLRAEMARNDQFATNSSDAIAWLSTADQAYSSSVTVLQQARGYVLQGLNTGASDANAAETLASQVDHLRSSLIDLANTQYNGRPIFGGTTANGVAYDSTGTYVGDNGTVTRAVTTDATVTVATPGTAAFGSGGNDVFSVLQNISDTLRSNPSALTGAVAQLDSAISSVSSAQAVAGANYQRVQLAQSSQTTVGTALKGQLSDIVDIDLASMAVQVTSANTAYQAALQTTANIHQMSLLDFLK